MSFDVKSSKVFTALDVTNNFRVGKNLHADNHINSGELQSSRCNVRGSYIFMNDTNTSSTETIGGIVFNTKAVAPPVGADTNIQSTTADSVTIANLPAGYLAAGDFIQLSGIVNNPTNNGVYEVLSVAADTVTIDTTNNLGFCKVGLTASSEVSGVIQKIYVTVLEIREGSLGARHGDNKPDFLASDTLFQNNLSKIVHLKSSVDGTSVDYSTKTSLELAEVYIVDADTGDITLTLGASATSGTKLKIIGAGANVAKVAFGDGVTTGFDTNPSITELTLTEYEKHVLMYYNHSGVSTWLVE